MNKALDQYLHENRITQTEFAERIGVTPGRVHQLLNGKDGRPSLWLAGRIEKATGGAVTFTDWLQDQDGDAA